MTDEQKALQEAVVKLYADKYQITDAWLADAAIAVALERAAQVADAAEKQANEDARYWEVDAGLRCQDIAAAIRALVPHD